MASNNVIRMRFILLMRLVKPVTKIYFVNMIQKYNFDEKIMFYQTIVTIVNEFVRNYTDLHIVIH